MTRRNPSLAALVGFFLFVALFVGSYFSIVRIEHSAATGSPSATYPGFVEPMSILYRPIEAIDRRIRTDVWAARDVEAEFRQQEVDARGVVNQTLRAALDAHIADRNAERRIREVRDAQIPSEQ